MHKHLLVHWIPESDSKLCRVVGEETREQQRVREATRHNFPGGIASQIVWRQLAHACTLGGFLHNVPNRLHRHAISPCPSYFVDPAEKFPSINSSCGEPIVQLSSHPIRNWNCSNQSDQQWPNALR